MSRYDKYGPITGGSRGRLNAAWTATSGPSGTTDLFRVTGVALNGSGRVVKATTALGCIGVFIAHGAKAAGEVIDIMRNGEIVELAALDLQANTAPVVGTIYYVDLTNGLLTATAPGAGVNAAKVGYTTDDATRLVVNFEHVQG